MQHGLPFDGLFDRAHTIADSRGLLELEARRVILHQVAHLAEQLEIFSFEQHLRRVQMAAVLFAIDRQTARPQASLDLIFEARPRAIGGHRVGAGAQRKDFADDVDRLAQSVGRAERAEVAPAVLDDLAGDRDSRPCVIGDLRAQLRFVVFEAILYLGRYCLIRLFSRISASFSLAVTIVSKSRTRRIRKRTWKRPSPPSRKDARTRERSDLALPT